MMIVKPHLSRADPRKIKADRERYGKSLVVAATGTGKTMLSAFDYKAFADERITKGDDQTPTLLFMLTAGKSETKLGCFRLVMRDQNFGKCSGGIMKLILFC